MAAGAVFSLPFILYFTENLDVALRYLWSVPLGQTDPIYGRDLGFYLFELPFLQMLQNSLTALAFLSLALVFGLSLLLGFVRTESNGAAPPRRAMLRHLGLGFALFVAGNGWGFYLDRFELLYSDSGLVYGAGYTDLHLVRVALWVMVAASALLALLALFIRRRARLRPAAWGVMAYAGLMVLALGILPRIIQNFVVEPNELELESPYLRHEIAFTRQAYGIDRVEELSYAALSDLSAEHLENNRQTLRNVRLWDWRPLLQTFRQLQEIRLYYQFYEVDVDRYHLDGEYRQVMLSARELAGRLPERADTWVNRSLQFTHGYGLTMSLASQEGEEGTPKFLIRDLPPVTGEGLRLEQAAIYYGENMPGYRIVNTGVREFDYPKGDENVYTRYGGKGGIALDGLGKKLLFAWEFGDLGILLSDYLQPQSRLQMRRQVRQRVGAPAPFLLLDSDPYLVLADGRLYWIQDAYTASDRYPYSEPYGGAHQLPAQLGQGRGRCL